MAPVDQRAAGVSLSRKDAKSQTQGRKLRSTGTKGRTRVSSSELRTELERELAAHACELEKKLEERTRQLADVQERLTEALEQQTGSSEVLRVISGSAGHLEPVFQAILEKAVRICDAKFGVLMMFEAGGFRHVTFHGTTQAYAEAMRRELVFHPSAGHPLYRLAKTKRVVHIADMRAERKAPGRLVRLAGARTLLLVPMLSKNGLVGGIAIYRQEVRTFTNKQIELMQNFAAQAVIAVENTRLLNELRESLQQQTATSDVLQVISSSPGELAPVFEAMLANAARICEATFGNMYLREGDELRVVAMHGAPRAFEELRRHDPRVPSTVRRMYDSKQIIHCADLAAEEAYANLPLVRLAGARSAVVVDR